ncbi:hypothetical protein EDD29_4538 [Actinocorallia herbida]|uniref:Uncharacterized protein n=1 Tax=Actinocorallia herbida TaxID=58109 RepID=A0A3N1D0A3_9ACTN|nr:hypothetical protein [Actinocorallia herbida]ROO86952.1 hypothetical protein EDD29_4538 [Actinocorallia herbida]
MSSRTPWWGECPPGFAFAAGCAAAVGGCLLAAVLDRTPDGRLVVLALCLGGTAAAVRHLPALLATAVVGWLCHLGFLVETGGELVWHGGVDGWRLGVLVAAVVLGSAPWLIANAARSTRSFRAGTGEPDAAEGVPGPSKAPLRRWSAEGRLGGGPVVRR